MNDCPVCGKAGLAADAATCPQCGADLECFQLLDALHEDSVGGDGSDAPRAQSPKRGRKTGWFVVLILGVAWFYSGEDEPSDTSAQPTAAERRRTADAVSSLTDGLEQRMQRFENTLSGVATRQKVVQRNQEAARQQLSTVSDHLLEVERSLSVMDFQQASQANRAGSFRHCLPRDQAPLPTIAERCYGDRALYPLLLEYNPGLGIHYEHTFGPLKVIKDRKTAHALVQQLTIILPEHTLMRYRVIRGDSWPTLSMRLFGDTSHSSHLKALNRNRPLRSGERVLIPLPK